MTETKLQEARHTLAEVFGSGISHRNGEVSYFCPFCGHYKPKLQININTEAYHCWVCNIKGRKLTQLFKKCNAPIQAYQKIKEIYGEARHISNKSISRELLSLPDNYRPLYLKSNTPDYKNALHYALTIRKLTPTDILRYQVGYCEEGLYAGMLIIPSYGEHNSLNFYTGRSFYSEANRSHKNPPVSKDVIGFENQVNWKEPIVLVEGAFDAIATKRNAIPLFGKKIMGNLRSKILTEGVQKLYLALDNDAFEDSVKEIEYFLNNGVEVFYVNLSGKDPSDIGYECMVNCLNKAKQVDFLDLVKLKMLL